MSNEIRNIAVNIDSKKKADHILEMQKLENFYFKVYVVLLLSYFVGHPEAGRLQMIRWRKRP